MQKQLINRLITYAKIDTQSDDQSSTTPSTPGQWDLLRELEKEIKEIGLVDVQMDAHGYLFGTVEGPAADVGYFRA